MVADFLRRYRPLAVVATWLVGWALAINVALLFLAQTPVLGWLPDRQTGAGFVLDNQQRVASAIADYRAGRVARGDHLVAVTGISNVREGVNVDILRQRLGPSVRVLGIAGAGAGAKAIVENANTLLHSSLRPDMVILGIAPLQMLDTLMTPGVIPAGMPQPTVRERLREWVRQGFWIFARRNDISISVDNALLGLRGAMFTALGLRLPAPAVDSAWRPMMRVMGAEHFPEATLVAGVDWARSIGTFDRTAYAQARVAPLMIAQLVRQFHDRGAKVIVVVTPEHTLLRRREPAGIVASITDRLKHDSGIPNLQVLDMRAYISNAGFVDLSHLNSIGSRRFSYALAEQISKLD